MAVNKVDLSEFIQNRLSQKGWKVSDLARNCDVSHVYIGYIIKRLDPNTGKAPNPTADKLIELAKGLGESPAKLIMAYSGKDPDAVESEGLASGQFREALTNFLFESLDLISQEDRETALKIILHNRRGPGKLKKKGSE